MNNTNQQYQALLLKIAATLLLCFLTACASTTPDYDAKFGDAVRAAVAQQILNPEASQNTDPVSGIDGKAAQHAMERYHDSFKEPVTTSDSFTFELGSGSSSSSGANQ